MITLEEVKNKIRIKWGSDTLNTLYRNISGNDVDLATDSAIYLDLELLNKKELKCSDYIVTRGGLYYYLFFYGNSGKTEVAEKFSKIYEKLLEYGIEKRIKLSIFRGGPLSLTRLRTLLDVLIEFDYSVVGYKDKYFLLEKNEK